MSAFYRITAVKNGATTNQAYSYDNGGRVTSMTRDSATRSFGYNSTDHLTAVTNGATWTTYLHDAQGRRTKSTDNTGAQRRFLVAGTPGTDLESFHLIADSTNGLSQGYVFAGDDPVLRYDNAGNRIYYLEDAMRSVIGLAPHSSPGTANTTKLFYDGFGKTRMTNGPAPTLPSGTGGDFRFHGAWWESATDLYYMRAREYDQRMGRSVSRDPDAGEFRIPESLNPYTYAFSNPQIYFDLSGEFSVTEISISGAIQTSLSALRTVVISRAKNFAVQKAVDSFSSVAYQQLELLFPGLSQIRNLFTQGPKAAGRKLEDLVSQSVCNRLPSFVRESLWLGPAVAEDGDPVSDGFSCTLSFLVPKRGTGKKGVCRPDFILSPTAPSNLPFGGYEKAYLIGDIKISGQQLYTQYIADGANRSGQGLAIVNFAAQHSQTRVALFLTIYPGNRSDLAKFKTSIFRSALKKGVLIFVISAR